MPNCFQSGHSSFNHDEAERQEEEEQCSDVCLRRHSSNAEAYIGAYYIIHIYRYRRRIKEKQGEEEAETAVEPAGVMRDRMHRKMRKTKI